MCVSIAFTLTNRRTGPARSVQPFCAAIAVRGEQWIEPEAGATYLCAETDLHLQLAWEPFDVTLTGEKTEEYAAPKAKSERKLPWRWCLRSSAAFTFQAGKMLEPLC